MPEFYTASRPAARGPWPAARRREPSAPRAGRRGGAWIAAVELASEVVGGAGTRVLREFAVEVR